MDTPLYLFCAVIGWIAFAYKLRDLRQDPANRVLRAMVRAFCSFAVGITFAVPPLAGAVDAVTGLPNLAKILSHACVISIAANAEILLLFLALPPERAAPQVRIRLWSAAAALGVLGTLWLLTLSTDPPVYLHINDAQAPVVTSYLTVYLVVFVGYCADIARLCWRFARVSPRSSLRLGLQITAIGATFALGYCAGKAAYLTAYRFGYEPPGEPELSAVLVTIGAFLMIIGLTLPTWGPSVGATANWARRIRAWRRLRPLWRSIAAVQPDLVLDEQAHRWSTALRDVDYALHRRITEIRDGRLALRPFIDVRVAELAERLAAEAGLTPRSRAVVIEAAMLAAGIRAARTGDPVARPDYTPPHSPDDGGYREEIEWLTKVAEAYGRSAIVTTVLHRTTRPAMDPAATTGGAG